MEMKLSEFECADCGATINEGEYVTFGVCDKCFQKNYRERMGLPEEKKNTMENIVEREFKQTGEILTDIVGDFFKRVIQDPKGMGIEVKEFENSDTRLSLLKRDDRTIAGVVETRTEFNNVEFIKFSLYKDHPTTASGSVAAPKEEGNTEPYFHLSKNEYGKMWLMYKPEGNRRYKCWEPITEEFWNEFEKLLR